MLSLISQQTSVGEDAEKTEPLFLVVLQIGASIIDNSMEVLKKLKIELPYDPAIPYLGIYPKKFKTLI